MRIPRRTSRSELLVLDSFELKEPKSREAVRVLRAFKLDSALLVDSRENTNLFLAVRNLPGVKAVDTDSLNIFDVLNHKWLVFSRRAFESAMERWK